MKKITVDGQVYIAEKDVPKVKTTVKSVSSPFKLGVQYFIQTVTHFYVGTLVAVTPTDFVLENAAWVADTGRFNEFCAGKKPVELEPCGNVVINRGAYVCAIQSKVNIEVV